MFAITASDADRLKVGRKQTCSSLHFHVTATVNSFLIRLEGETLRGDPNMTPHLSLTTNLSHRLLFPRAHQYGRRSAVPVVWLLDS
jgi:hypothetical protein